MAFYYFSNLCCQVSLMKWRTDKADLFLYRVPNLSFRGPGVAPSKTHHGEYAGSLGLTKNLSQTYKFWSRGENTRQRVRS